MAAKKVQEDRARKKAKRENEEIPLDFQPSFIGDTDETVLDSIPKIKFTTVFDYVDYNNKHDMIRVLDVFRDNLRTCTDTLLYPDMDKMKKNVVDANFGANKLVIAWIDIDERQILYDATEYFGKLYFFQLAIQDGYSNEIRSYSNKNKLEIMDNLVKSVNDLSEQITNQVTRLYHIYKGEKIAADHAQFDEALREVIRLLGDFNDLNDTKKFVNSEAFKMVRIVCAVACILACPPSDFPMYEYIIMNRKLLLLPDMTNDYEGISGALVPVSDELEEDSFEILQVMTNTTEFDFDTFADDLERLYVKKGVVIEYGYKSSKLSENSNKCVDWLLNIVFWYPAVAREQVVTIIHSLLHGENPSLHIDAMKERWVSLSSLFHLYYMDTVRKAVTGIMELHGLKVTDIARRIEIVGVIWKPLQALTYDIREDKGRKQMYEHYNLTENEKELAETEYQRIQALVVREERLKAEFNFAMEIFKVKVGEKSGTASGDLFGGGKYY